MTVAADITTRPRSYRACSIKRDRRTKAEIDDIKAAIVAALKGNHPMTVRQVFYRLVVQKVIEKTEKEYQQTVIRLLTEMRLSGRIRFDWIVDESRPRIVNRTYDSIADAARDTARFYRRNALRECSDYVEIWCEKQALAGVIGDAAEEYDVPVLISKGMPSLTQLYGTACEICRQTRPESRPTSINSATTILPAYSFRRLSSAGSTNFARSSTVAGPSWNGSH
jgi:hypothetical protein